MAAPFENRSQGSALWFFVLDFKQPFEFYTTAYILMVKYKWNVKPLTRRGSYFFFSAAYCDKHWTERWEEFTPCGRSSPKQIKTMHYDLCIQGDDHWRLLLA